MILWCYGNCFLGGVLSLSVDLPPTHTLHIDSLLSAWAWLWLWAWSIHNPPFPYEGSPHLHWFKLGIKGSFLGTALNCVSILVTLGFFQGHQKYVIALRHCFCSIIVYQTLDETGVVHQNQLHHLGTTMGPLGKHRGTTWKPSGNNLRITGDHLGTTWWNHVTGAWSGAWSGARVTRSATLSRNDMLLGLSFHFPYAIPYSIH